MGRDGPHLDGIIHHGSAQPPNPAPAPTGHPEPPLPPQSPTRGGYQGSRPSGPVEVPRGPAADVPGDSPRHLPEVRYEPLGKLVTDFEWDSEKGPYWLSTPVHMCLRCGAVVVAIETARHDLAHIAAEGHIPEGSWALIDRPVGF